MTLHVKKLNHGQSEIWIDPHVRRVIATNEVRSAVTLLAETEDGRHFNANYPVIGEEITFEGQNVAEIAAALGVTR